MAGKINCNRTVRLEITDPDPEALLKKLTDANIVLEDIVFPDFLTVQITVSKRNCSSVYTIVDQQGAECKVLSKKGILWEMSDLLHRPVLLCGGILFLLLILLLPGRILRVEVVGNHCVPSRYILQCAEMSGIRVGSLSRTVRSEKTKNQMLRAIPELQWIGINTRGCVATIKVKERSIAPETEETAGVASIIAVRDGIISDVTVHSGTALCVPGQSVLKGEVLVSGYCDQGLKVTATVAHGEVFAYTRREVQAVSPVPTVTQGVLTDEHTCYRLKIGKKVINFCNHSGIPDATCDKMYSEYYWTLPGGFCLPVSVIKETFRYYEQQTIPEKENCAPWLEADSEAYLTDQMVAGEILHAAKSMESTEECFRLSGVYFCREMIGKVRYEEILENHAKNN